MKFFRLDYFIYLIIILISLIPLNFSAPGKLEISLIEIENSESNALWREDVGGSGYFDYEPIKKYEKVSKYTFNPEGYAPYSISSNPILFKDTIYITFKDYLVALNLKDGKEKWRMKVSIDPKTSITAIDKYIFFPERKSTSIIGIDTESKEIVFKYNFKREIVITPLNYKDGVIYFGTQYFLSHASQSNEPLHIIMNAYDIKSNKFIFRYKVINQRMISYPTIDKNTLIFTTNNIIALDIKTGEKKWKRVSEGYVSELVPVKDGIGYYYENIKDSSTLYAVDIQTGHDIWKYDFNKIVLGIPSIDEKNIYLTSWDGTLYSIDRLNGKINWVKDNFNIIDNSLIVVKDIIYLVDGVNLVALNKDNGELIWKGEERIGKPIYSPIASDKFLLIPHSFELYLYTN